MTIPPILNLTSNVPLITDHTLPNEYTLSTLIFCSPYPFGRLNIIYTILNKEHKLNVR